MSGPDRSPATPSTDRAGGRSWAGLALLVLPMLMLSTDLTVLFFAMPTIDSALEASATESLWIVHVYGFCIAGFLITMGRLGDRIGSRRLLLIGAAAFGAMSMLAAFSTTPAMLIAARALMGLAGATLMPSLFSLLRIMFADEDQRRLAIAVMFSAFSVGGAIGPLVGGALLESFWWGSVFLINVPAMLLLLIAGPAMLPERPDRAVVRLDIASVALSVTGILAVVYGLQELADESAGDSGAASWPYLAAIVTGALLLGAFVRRQRRLAEPLFDLALLTERRLAVGLVALLLVGIGVVGTFYLFTQYLQWVAELSPLQAGLWTLPYIGVNIAGAMLAPGLAARTQPALVVATALAVAALGAAGVAATAGTHPTLVVIALSVVGAGQGAAMALVSDLIISSAPAHQTGSAAAAQEVGGELGSALGIALGGVVGLLAYRASLSGGWSDQVPESTARAAMSSIHEGVELGRSSAAGGLGDAVREAVAAGIEVYASLTAVLVAAAAILVWRLLARRR